MFHVPFWDTVYVFASKLVFNDIITCIHCPNLIEKFIFARATVTLVVCYLMIVESLCK